MSIFFRTQLIAACLGISLALSSQTEAFFTDVKGFGMGAAVTAHPIDSLSGAYNPAGLAFVGNRWDLGLHWAKDWGEAKYSGNEFIDGRFDSHSSWDNFFIPEFGVNKYTCDCDFTWGFLLYNRDFYKTEFDHDNPIFGTSHPGLEYLHYVAAITGTLRFGCNHAIGLTIDLHGQRLKINGLENFETARSKHPGSVTNEGYDYSGGAGVTVGWLSKASDCVSIGVAWSPTVIMSRFSDYKGIVPRKGRLNIPQRFLGGVAIKMVENFTVAFDIEHTKYNEISPLNHPLLPNFFRHRLGSDQGAGLGWMDQTTFRLGAEWIVNKSVDLRLGYIYHRTPVKSEETLFNTLVANILERFITWGLTWRLDRCNELNFYGAYGFWNEKEGRNSIPERLEFGGGNVDIREEMWMAGFSWGRYF